MDQKGFHSKKERSIALIFQMVSFEETGENLESLLEVLSQQEKAKMARSALRGRYILRHKGRRLRSHAVRPIERHVRAYVLPSGEGVQMSIVRSK